MILTQIIRLRLIIRRILQFFTGLVQLVRLVRGKWLPSSCDRAFYVWLDRNFCGLISNCHQTRKLGEVRSVVKPTFVLA